MATKQISAGKGNKIRSVQIMSGEPTGKTTVKLNVRRGRFAIPFPKKRILDGTGWQQVSSGMAPDGTEFIVLEKKNGSTKKRNNPVKRPLGIR